MQSHLRYTPPEVSPTEPNATDCAGKQVGGSLPEDLAAPDKWRLDGHDGSRHVSRDRRSIPPTSCNVKEAVIAAFRKLKAVPSDPTRSPRMHCWRCSWDRCWFTPLVFDLCSGSGIRWGVLLSTSGSRPNSKTSGSEQIPITVEEIVSRLRTEVHLGEAQNVVVWLCRAEIRESSRRSVKLNTPALFWVKSEASSSKSIQETPQLFLPPALTLKIQPTTSLPSINESTQSKLTSESLKLKPPQHHPLYS
ncbi:hypothetical protein B9Z19DRAFT_1067648 [Tuber borchii]|uniref:Uncharacterized protein n=1 Tax=Tuber borchii TaxID=42251 RepID=A0A2T6ZI56_TUBBO|nr:hypothetical protein B9Z19DRAFT_1067648 [Tuber borchii]